MEDSVVKSVDIPLKDNLSLSYVSNKLFFSKSCLLRWPLV
jgi:hypothetical protein